MLDIKNHAMKKFTGKLNQIRNIIVHNEVLSTIFMLLVWFLWGYGIIYLVQRYDSKEISETIAKCPEDYLEDETGTEEYRNALIDWTVSFLEQNPQATISGWSTAKLKHWEDNNCKVAIERSKMSGEVTDLKPWERVDYEIQNAVNKALEDSNALKIMEAIKKLESKEPPRISENPTEEEIYNSKYIKHIRVALDRYLKDPKSEVDASLSEPLDSGNKCGLDSFDKAYYKSKFIVFFAQDNDYGGVQAYLFSVDKPDTLFWAWVYKAGEEEYQLRAFCESDSTFFESKAQFEDFTKEMIKDSKYPL